MLIGAPIGIPLLLTQSFELLRGAVHVQLVERDIPVRIENLEPALLLSRKRRGVWIQLLDDLRVVRRTGHRRNIAVGNDNREGPISPSIPVIGRNECADVLDPSGLHLLLEDRIMILAEKTDEFVLKPPFDAIEVPDRPLGREADCAAGA